MLVYFQNINGNDKHILHTHAGCNFALEKIITGFIKTVLISRTSQVAQEKHLVSLKTSNPLPLPFSLSQDMPRGHPRGS